jgi:ketosteroid isomerase-like protein
MDSSKLDRLFADYEKSFDRLDLAAIARLYADTFISAGPKGTIAQNKKEFEEKAREAAAFYKSIGQKEARILSKKVHPISNEYAMVTVHWAVKFEKTGDRLIEFDVSYIVQQTDDKMKILLFISHEDEEEAMKKLGLQPALSP